LFSKNETDMQVTGLHKNNVKAPFFYMDFYGPLWTKLMVIE